MCNLNSELYDAFMSPLERMRLSKYRSFIIPKAYGNTLEIGPGTGANLKFYNWNLVSKLTLLDIKIDEKIRSYPFPSALPIDYIETSAETLPFPSNSFDSIVFTLVFCSIPDPLKGLNEVYRVLKPKGKIYFIEHVLSHHQPYKNILNTLNIAWPKIASGCNLNRDTIDTIKQAKFNIVEYKNFWKGIFVRGIAVK